MRVKMSNGVVTEFLIWCFIVVVCCYGKPVAEPQDIVQGDSNTGRASNQETLQKLYSLLNETLLRETLAGYPKREVVAAPAPAPLSNEDELFTSIPFIEEEVKNKATSQSVTSTNTLPLSLNFDERLKEPTFKPTTTTKSPLEYKPQRPPFATQISSGHLGQLIPPGKPWPADPPNMNTSVEDRFQETTIGPLQDAQSTTKLPLEYDPQRPSFAGSFSSGQLGQLIPLGTTKSPLEYKPQRPPFATQISSGHLGQLIPPGKPWPADPPNMGTTIEDRFKETTLGPLQDAQSTSKSPLEYNPQKPSFAGTFSSGHLGQLIPPGKPWPADPPNMNTSVEDRFKETTLGPLQDAQSTSTFPLEYNPQKPSFAGSFSSGQLGQLIPLGTTKSPLEYKPQRPPFATQISSGHLGQLIPPGKPWPADPPNMNTSVEDRFKETTLGPLQDAQSTTKSPLEYNPQRPSFAGTLSSGQLGQLIPPGKPWPADPPNMNTSVEDRFQETTIGPLQDAQSTTKSPLEYDPQRPSFAGTFSSGHLGQLIPPGKPWPADPPNMGTTIEDRFKETTLGPLQDAQSTSKSPLEYDPQRPSFAGSFSSGQLGQLIPPGTTKSPLEYKPQRPPFATQISSGHLGQLIPPGKPWPADPPNMGTTIEDRFKETTLGPLQDAQSTSKSPLEYDPQRPSFAGSFSSGQLGQLIPPGTTKSPLEYKPQRPPFATQISSGHLGQLIPPGKPWPADPPNMNTSVEDRFKETTLGPLQDAQSTSKSPLEYDPQRPSFAGTLSSGQLGQLIPLGTTKSPLEYKPQRPPFATQISSGHLGQLIPPGKPWPADPPNMNTSAEDRFKETTLGPLQDAQSTSKSPLEYNPQKPSFVGTLSSGQLGQLIFPGKPWPADPSNMNTSVEDRFKETTLEPLQDAQSTTKSPLEYDPQRPSFAGSFSSGQLGQLIPPGKPWPAGPPNTNLEDRFQETTLEPLQALYTTIRAPSEYESSSLPYPTNKPHKCGCKLCHHRDASSKQMLKEPSDNFYDSHPWAVKNAVAQPLDYNTPFGNPWPVGLVDDIEEPAFVRRLPNGQFVNPGPVWFVPPFSYFNTKRVNDY